MTPRPISLTGDLSNNKDGAGNDIFTAGADAPSIYPIYMFGQGVVQEGIQQDFRLATERNILSFQDIMACDWHYAMGIAGIDYTGASAGPSPAAMGGGAAFNVAGKPGPALAATYPLPAAIADSGNYALKWDARTIPCVKLEALTPFGAKSNAIA